MNKTWLLIYLLVLPALVMCGRKKDNTPTESQIRQAKEAMVGANRLLIKKDKEKIIRYSDSLGLALMETETGLWYRIISQGGGLKPTEGDLVSLEYTVSLLDGKTCYSSESSGPKQFITGQGGAETGLDEGVRLLPEGSEAIFVLPPHLAHGLTGDGDCIPARSVIIYKVRLLKVEP